MTDHIPEKIAIYPYPESVDGVTPADAIISVSAPNTSVAKGDPVSFVVSVDSPALSDVTFDVDFSTSTTQAGDFEAGAPFLINGSYTIQSGQTQMTLTDNTIIGSAVGTRNATIIISNEQGGGYNSLTLGTATATVALEDPASGVFEQSYFPSNAGATSVVSGVNWVPDANLFTGQNGVTGQYQYADPVGIDLTPGSATSTFQFDQGLPADAELWVRCAAYANGAANTRFGIQENGGTRIDVQANASASFDWVQVPGTFLAGQNVYTVHFQDGGVALDEFRFLNVGNPDAPTGGTGAGGGTGGGSSGDTTGNQTPDTLSTIGKMNEAHADFISWRAKVGHAAQTPPVVSGTTRQASTEAAFNAALSASAVGDGINIGAGNHNWGVKEIPSSKLGITITQDAGCAFTGNHEWHCKGSDNVFFGLKLEQSFTGSGNKYCIFTDVGAARTKIIGCHADGVTNAGGYRAVIDSRGPDVEVAHNLIENLPTNVWGISLAPNANNPQQCKRNHVHHNTLRNSGVGHTSSGAPALKIGILSTSTEALVEWNDFDQWDADNETFEIKGSDNVILNNYVHNCNNSPHISNRHGSRNIYWGNVGYDMIRGIIFAGSDNRFIYNYANQRSGVYFMVYYYHETDGGGDVYKMEPPGNNNIAQRNVFYDFQRWGGSDSFNGAIVSSPGGNQIIDNYLCNIPGMGQQSNFLERSFWSYAQHVAANPVGANFTYNTSGANYASAGGAIADAVVSIGGRDYGKPEWWDAIKVA